MKSILSLVFLTLLSFTLFAQPSNDDCSGVIDLGVAPVCDGTVYTNIDATPFDIGSNNQPDCFASNPPVNDVWFQFTTAADIVDYTITVEGTIDGVNMDALNNVQFAIYRGFCSEGTLFFNNCAVGALNQQALSLDLENLTPSEVYYIRIDNFGDNADEGDFTICVEEKVNNTVEDGSSNACTGTLTDTGGPDGNYGDNENNTFTICPAQITNCITLDFMYYNIEPGDNIIIYNGPDNNSPVITSFSGFGGQQGGGGVCLSVQADSCMTIEFTSDGFGNFEGFEANWFCSATSCETNDPLTVEIGADPETIENTISTPTAQVTIDTIICDDGAYGTFTFGDDTDLGLERGLILTSGSPNNAIGPNTSTSAGDIVGDFDDGDEDLDVLSELFGDFSTSNDACIVEVDVTVFTEILEFEYIFGSEEYPEFVNTGFNDIFALLISGPGIDGIAQIGGQDNMAIIPDTDIPIQINSVNNFENWEYYRDNNNGQSLEYDGLTSGFLGNKKSLTASAVVMPCSTYHLKFAIADRGDSSFDSGVFISEIRSGVANIETSFTSGLDYFVEKCLSSSNDTVIISLEEALFTETEYTVQIGGTAVQPDDYTLDIPDTITFGVGQTILKFPIEVFDDDITEGDETVVISLFRNFGCGDILVNELEIPIRENILVEIETEQDSIIACAETSVQLNATGANSYTWQPFSVFDNPFVSNPIVEAGFEGWVYVEGQIVPFTDEECIGQDSIYIDLVEPQVSIKADDLEICEGETITLTALNNVNDNNVTWVITNSFQQVDDPTSATTTFTPTFGFIGLELEVVVTVELGGCTASDTAIISVDPYDFLQPVFTDTTVCQGEVLMLNEFAFIYGVTYEIDPTDNIIDPTDPFSEVIANESIEYTAITSSPSEFCMDTFMYNIEVIPNEIIINQGDTARICLGDDIDLTTSIMPTTGIVTWTEEDSLTINGNDANANPTETTWYFVDVDNGACTAADSILVFVDSLPAMPISAIPVRDPYCLGETITFVSPGYFVGDFPLIEHSWEPTVGFQPDSENNYNVALSAVDTTTYIRTTTNGACTVMDTITINVIDPSIELNISDTIICQGESLDFDLTSDFELDNIQWSTGSGEFTCDDCEMTTLNDITSSTTVSVSADADGCPTETSAEVTILSYNGTITFLPSEVCPGFVGPVDISFTLDGGIPAGSSFKWFNGNTELTQFANQEVITLNIDISTLISTDFTVEYTSPEGCISSFTNSLFINNNPYGIETIITPDSLINNCYSYGDIINISALFNPPAPEGSTITWTFNGEELVEFADLSIISAIVPSDNSNAEIDFSYSVTITDPEGCTSTFTETLCARPRFEIPDAFSPIASSGVNDVFRIVDRGNGMNGVNVLAFKIYNRWGQRVFDCSDFECATITGWDGTFNGVDQPGGTYMYYIELEYPDGRLQKFEGDLILLTQRQQ